MSAYQYDKSVIENLRKIFKKSNIYINVPDNNFDIVASLNRDQIKLPMIALNRVGYSLLSYKPQHMIFNGHLVEIIEDEEDTTFTGIQAIPIRINYQIDVYTASREENDLIMRELIFYYTLNPTLKVNIPYGLNIEHNFNLLLNDEIEDNSDISQHSKTGRLYRQTLEMYTDDAYLWKSSLTKFSDIDIPKLLSIETIQKGGIIDVENIQRS